MYYVASVVDIVLVINFGLEFLELPCTCVIVFIILFGYMSVCTCRNYSSPEDKNISCCEASS